MLLNVGTTPILPVLYFSDQRSASIDADSVVEVTDDQEALEDDGGLTVQKAIEPLGELTISTHGRGEELSGSVKVVSEGKRFTGLAVEVDGANRIFTTLPVVPVMERTQRRDPLSKELVIQREAGMAGANPRLNGPSQ